MSAFASSKQLIINSYSMLYSSVVILVLTTFHSCLGSFQISKEWKEPDAWSRGDAVTVPQNGEAIDNIINPQECIVKMEDSNKDSQLTSIFYRKLLLLLFNKKLFVDDMGSYKRIFQLTLTSEDFDILKKSIDPRDLDEIVTRVFHSASQVNNNCMDKDSSVLLIFEWAKSVLWSISLQQELPFLLFIGCFLLIIFLVHKKYNYSVFAIFVTSCFLFGFMHTYYECNIHLQIEEMKVLQLNNNDPCENYESNRNSWSIWKLFGRSSQQECIDYLKNKHKINLPFCRPDDVFLKYVNEIIFSQLQKFIEKMSIILENSIVKLSFPYNYIALVLVICSVMPVLLKLIFQHVIDPRVWRENVQVHNVRTSQPDIQHNNEMLVNQLLYEKIENHKKQTDEKISNLEKNISNVQILAGESVNSSKVLNSQSNEDSEKQIHEPIEDILTEYVTVEDSKNVNDDCNLRVKCDNVQ